jgi:iron complex outermembrane receptor protein
MVCLSLLLTGASLAQSSVQTITADEEAQAGSQPAGATLEGNVADNKGGLIAKATIIVRNDATGRIKTSTADAMGHFRIAGLPIGTYTVDASAPGFSETTVKNIHVAADHADTVSVTLEIGSTTSDVTVEADTTGSVAASLAPMDALLTETSARTEITGAMIQNFMSPVADYGEAVEMAPGTFTTNSNGVGLGQSKTYFRGFPDGDYDIKFDGIPWSDTNSVPGPSSRRNSSAALTSTARPAPPPPSATLRSAAPLTCSPSPFPPSRTSAAKPLTAPSTPSSLMASTTRASSARLTSST